MTDRRSIPHVRAVTPLHWPEVIVRVAVTGHLPRDIDLANEPAIRKSIRAILEAVIAGGATLASSYGTAQPVLRVLSSLAEGSDRMVAEEALALKLRHAVTLECPLPAARDEYRNDFKTAESRERFGELLDQATAVFELDGERDGEWLRSSDYRRAGHIAISNCDLLIAIWDGKPGKHGGTAEIAQEAMEHALPVLRIDVDNPASITICSARDRWESDWQCALERSLRDAFTPPPTALKWVECYCGEKIGVGAKDVSRPDKLAKRYGGLYRVSYRLKYALSSLAVAFAVAGLWPGQIENRLWPAMELASIMSVLLCFLLAWKFKWHERWLDYRLLAEQFRVLKFLRPLGETAPVFRPPAYWGGPAGRHACVHWYFRARLREYGLPRASVDAGYVEHRRREVLAVTRGQLRYNKGKHKSMKYLHRYLEWGGVGLFVVTAAACFAHLGQWGLAVLLGALTAALPAFGAAMEGLQAQEEAKRIEGDTSAMAEHLQGVEKRIAELPAEAGLGVISVIAFELAMEMTWEASGWHNLIHGQPPKVGG